PIRMRRYWYISGRSRNSSHNSGVVPGIPGNPVTSDPLANSYGSRYKESGMCLSYSIAILRNTSFLSLGRSISLIMSVALISIHFFHNFSLLMIPTSPYGRRNISNEIITALRAHKFLGHIGIPPGKLLSNYLKRVYHSPKEKTRHWLVSKL